MNVRDVLKQLRVRFAAAGLDTPDLDARILVRHFLGLTDADLITGQGEITPEHLGALDQAIERRLSGEPVSRILGFREFWGMNFKITPDTLDPRPDTERLVEMALESLKDRPPRHILDLGTGTGCILLSLLKEFPQARGLGIDINQGAVDVSRENAKTHGLSGRASFRQGNWTDSLAESDGLFDLIVSNPPYIPESDIESLLPEVRNHDPILALVGGKDGLDPYRILITETKKFLAPGGVCLFEIGQNQDADLVRLVEESGLAVRRLGADYAGILRVVEIAHGDN